MNVYKAFIGRDLVAVYMDETKLRKLILQAITMHYEEMAERYRRIMEEESQ